MSKQSKVRDVSVDQSVVPSTPLEYPKFIFSRFLLSSIALSSEIASSIFATLLKKT